LQAQAIAEMAAMSDQVQIHYDEAPRQVAALEEITKYHKADSFAPTKTKHMCLHICYFHCMAFFIELIVL
jgi:hypothetical protein